MKITHRWLLDRCDDDAGCLIWRNQVSRDGAPIAWSPLDENRQRYKVQVRRLAWELRNGPIPEGMRVSCTCTNQRCLSCLSLASAGEVIHRQWSKPDMRARRTAALTKASRARGKLDMEKARFIRESDCTLKELSERLGISMTIASLVRRGLAWREDRNPFAGLGA